MKGLAKTGIFFAVLGTLFAGVGLWLFWTDSEFAANGNPARGTVIEVGRYTDSDGDTMYRPTIEFPDQNGTLREFTSDISSSSPDYSKGDGVPVIYDPADPESAIVNSFFERHLLPTIFTAMGSVFVCIGGVLACLPHWSRHRIDRLKTRGLAIEGIVTSVGRDTRIAINGSNPWRVAAKAQHPHSKTCETYKSEMLWERPFAVNEGDTITVYVSAGKPAKGHVDVTSAKAANAGHRQTAPWIPVGHSAGGKMP